MSEHIVFVGAGNMACAMISGLLRQGLAPSQMKALEPLASARNRLKSEFGVESHSESGPFLVQADLVVWAVKPQSFRAAAGPVQPHIQQALHLSIAAGIRSDSICKWLQTGRVVRTMPNTPALIGKGITAMYACPAVTEADRMLAQRVAASTGEFMWLGDENLIDAVTAISGSGPAYMFYFMEAMVAAGTQMGLSADQAYQLAVATFCGAGELARSSSEPPAELRRQVTSKGGTTHAAITSLENDQVGSLFIKAMRAAHCRAAEMGLEFGDTPTPSAE